MKPNQLISGKKYIFIMNPVDGSVVGLLPITESAIYLSVLKRKTGDYVRVQREDNSTYLIRCNEIHAIEEEIVENGHY